MGGFVAAWLTGEAIYAWRSVHQSGKPPVPGAMAGITLLFAGLAVVAELDPRARFPVTALAWGLNLAGIMNVLPKGLGGQVTAAQANEAAATAGTSGAASAAQGGTQS